MAKAANGTGSLYKVQTISGPRWQFSETVGRDSKGKLIRVTGTGKTQAEAKKRQQASLTRYLRKSNEASPLEAQGKRGNFTGLRHSELNLSVAKMCYSWLDSVEESVIGPATRRGYLHRIELHLAPPPFGNYTLKTLTPKQVRHHFQKTLPAKKKTTGPGKGVDQLLNKKALMNVWSAFSSAINWALEEGVLDKDPRTSTAKPKLSTAEIAADYRRQMEWAKNNWKPAKVLEHLEGRDDEAQWLIQFVLACRQSEKLGLQWDCFNNLFSKDKDRRVTVVFRQQLARKQVFHGCGTMNPRTQKFPCGSRNANACTKAQGESGYEIKHSTKTLGGMREIPVPDFLADALRRHKALQDEWKKSPDWKETPGLENLVFTTKLGTPLRHQQDTKDWRRICETLNLGDLRGHTARHFAATTMAARGVPLTTIGAIIGHASETITRLIYTHPDNDAMAEALAVMDTKYRPKKNNKS